MLYAVLAGIAGYFWVGLGYVAPHYVSRQVARHIRRRPTMARIPGIVDQWRRDAAGEGAIAGLFWVFYLPWRATANHIATAGPLTAFEIERKTAAQAREIARLERECEQLRRTQDV